MTLLEVLVALGILVAGLASVAALMPAASTRLADATAIDRAGTLAANAHADLRNRNALTSALFSNTTTKVVVLGKLTSLNQAADPFAAAPFGKDSAVLPLAAYTLQDEYQLGPTNAPFVSGSSACYGVTVIPTVSGTTPSAGSPVRVAAVVFKKPPVESQSFSLTKLSGGVFQLAGTGVTADASRKKFFPACSWVLAFSAASPEQSQWLRIGGSWTTGTTDAQGLLVPNVSYVSFSNADAPIITGNTTLTVHAFTRLLRVDERPAILK